MEKTRSRLGLPLAKQENAMSCYAQMTMLLAVALVFALAVSAYAITGTWKSRIEGFTRVSMSHNPTSNYVKVLQRFLICYNDTTNQLIIDGGGVDGIFGQKADSAVREFQSKRKITDDGDCGTNTWGEVATCLSSSTSGNVTTFITNYLCPSGYGSNVMKATLNSAGTYHTYSTYDQYGIAINSIFTRPV